MGSWRKAAGPRMLKAADVGQKPVKGTIVEVGVHTMKSKNGHTEEKVYIVVDKLPKAIGLNRTNGDYLAKEFGDDFDKWAGKKVEVYTEDTLYQGSPCKGIRVRATK
jgi:hypothetical protein